MPRNVSDIAISRLAGATYIDKTTRHGASCRPPTSSPSARRPTVYLDTPAQCVIEDSGWWRRVVIEKDGAISTRRLESLGRKSSRHGRSWRLPCVAGMACVETGNIADNEVLLPQNSGTRCRRQFP